MSSPAVLFRNELGQRLCSDTHFSLPNANILVGVLIDAMEYNLSARYHPLAYTTLQNVLKVSKEITNLSRLLQLNIQVKHRSIDTLHPFTLQALYMLALPATSLLIPCPEVVTLMTYIAVVHQLSAYIGPHAVYDLVSDFNRTIPRKLGTNLVKRVPGVGPRISRRRGAGSELRSVGPKNESPVNARVVYWTLPTQRWERSACLHGGSPGPSVPLQFPEAYGHAISTPNLRSQRAYGRVERFNPSTSQLLCRSQSGLYPAPGTRELHYDHYQVKLTSTPDSSSAPSATLIDAPTLPTPARASSPDPYRTSEELDIIGLNVQPLKATAFIATSPGEDTTPEFHSP